jgi:hypothetical protein
VFYCFVYGNFGVALLVLFLDLQKCAAARGRGCADTRDGGPLEEAVDAEIASEAAIGPEGPTGVDAMADVPVGGATRSIEPEVSRLNVCCSGTCCAEGNDMYPC